MTLHVIEPERRTLHGRFSRELEPVLTITSGDTVRYRLLDAGWGLATPSDTLGTRPRFGPRLEPRDSGHALCGPVAIEGAEPGMILEVQIDVIEPGDYGIADAGGPGDLNQQLGVSADEPEHTMVWRLDPQAMVGVNQYGHMVALRPFLGIIGMPPAEPGFHSSQPPRPTGGNLDCKELVAGSTLYLPIAVPGALVSVGDGHAVQGDGEVCGTAIECSMARVELTYRLRDDRPLSLPRANTPGGLITFGFHEQLDSATILALRGMLDLLEEQYNLPRADALALASLVVDVRVTQIVNQVRGVHAVLAHGALSGTPLANLQPGPRSGG
jgi:acetamidase/formamidase